MTFETIKDELTVNRGKDGVEVQWTPVHTPWTVVKRSTAAASQPLVESFPALASTVVEKEAQPASAAASSSSERQRWMRTKSDVPEPKAPPSVLTASMSSKASAAEQIAEPTPLVATEDFPCSGCCQGTKESCGWENEASASSRA